MRRQKLMTLSAAATVVSLLILLYQFRVQEFRLPRGRGSMPLEMLWHNVKDKSDSANPHPLAEALPRRCRNGTACIAFGTSYFGSWHSWLPYVRSWRLGGDEATCGLACDFAWDTDAADAVLFHGRDLQPQVRLSRRPQQYWVYINEESPLATKHLGLDVSSYPRLRFLFNWTATTSLSSSIHLTNGVLEPRPSPLPDGEQFYSASRKKHLAFAVISNCRYTFNRRTEKIAQLQKYMEVHVYGTCGNRKLMKNFTEFQKMSEQYRFYLSFEGAFCRDYITEKLHVNGFKSHAVPVAFGGLSRTDYERVSPPHSFVYALDFATMRQLADYLINLAADESRYAQFFEWKRRFKASPRVAQMCAICRKLHSVSGPSVVDLSKYSDVENNCRPVDFPYLL